MRPQNREGILGFQFSASLTLRKVEKFVLLSVGLAMLGGIVVLCKVYFFSAPLIGMSISLACYVASIALSRAFILRS